MSHEFSTVCDGKSFQENFFFPVRDKQTIDFYQMTDYTVVKIITRKKIQ